MKRLTHLLVVAAVVGTLYAATAWAEEVDKGEIPCGQTKSATIAAPGQRDVWTFTGAAGDRIYVYVKATSGPGQPFVSLSPATPGAVEASGTEGIDCQLKQSGPYTVAITHVGGYNVTFWNITQCPGTPLACDKTLSDTIDAASDQDLFEFTGQQGDRVYIYAKTTSGSLLPHLVLYPPSGGGKVTEADEGLDYQLQQSGTYKVQIFDSRTNDNAWMDDTGDYKVTFWNMIPLKNPCLHL